MRTRETRQLSSQLRETTAAHKPVRKRLWHLLKKGAAALTVAPAARRNAQVFHTLQRGRVGTMENTAPIVYDVLWRFQLVVYGVQTSLQILKSRVVGRIFLIMSRDRQSPFSADSV